MKIRYFIVAILSLVYLSSLSQPAFDCIKQSWQGYEVLLLGWLAVLVLDPRWWANVAFVYTIYWHLFKASRVVKAPKFLPFSLVFMMASGISCLFLYSPVGCPGRDAPTAVLGLEIGAYLWITSVCLLSVYTLGLLKKWSITPSANKALHTDT